MEYVIWGWILIMFIFIFSYISYCKKYYYTSIFLFILAFNSFIIFCAPFGNTIKLNINFRNKLIESIPESNAYVIAVDVVNKEVVDVVTKEEKLIATHHSFGYKNPIGVLDRLKLLWNMPLFRPTLINLAKTQNKTIEEQIDMGVRFFDIRISYQKNQYFVDHGIIFDTLDNCLDELINSTKNNYVTVGYNISAWDDSDKSLNEVYTYLRLRLPGNFEIMYVPNGTFDYIESNDFEAVANLVKNTEQAMVAGIVTPGITNFLLYLISLALSIVLVLIFKYST